MKETDAAYIAGLFDGEGSIYYVRRTEKKKKHKGKGHREAYCWRCTFRDAYYVCCMIWPYAHTKLPKIQKIVDHYAHLDNIIMNDKVVNLKEYKERMLLE